MKASRRPSSNRRHRPEWRHGCAGFLLLVLTACGQQGPLFLPEDDAPANKAATQQDETETETDKKDGDGPDRGG